MIFGLKETHNMWICCVSWVCDFMRKKVMGLLDPYAHIDTHKTHADTDTHTDMYIYCTTLCGRRLHGHNNFTKHDRNQLWNGTL